MAVIGAELRHDQTLHACFLLQELRKIKRGLDLNFSDQVYKGNPALSVPPPPSLSLSLSHSLPLSPSLLLTLSLSLKFHFYSPPPFPRSLCKLPKMFCIYILLLTFPPVVSHCYPFHFCCSRCFFLHVLILLMLYLSVSFYHNILL